MINVSFLNLCFSLLLQKDVKINEKTSKDIYEILIFYRSHEDKIPLISKQKFSLVFNVSKFRLEGKTREEIFDKILGNQLYKEFEHYIKQAEEHELNDEQLKLAIKRVNDRKKLITILIDLPHFESVISQFNNNSYEDIEEFVSSYERIISSAYTRMSEEKRQNSISKISQLDLLNDQFEPVIHQIQQSYSGKNSVSTGYSQLDEYLNGGFEPNRVYIFGGSSGDGKSTLLLNFVRNAVERVKNYDEKIGLKQIYIYVTLENLIDESLIRLYCSITNKDIKHVIKNFEDEKKNIERTIKAWQEDNNSCVIMTYFEPTITSVSDIIVYINEIENRYKNKGIIKAIYVDYLDLLKSGQKFDLYRLEMGQVVIDLKCLVVKKNIPCITLTQLTRSSYDHKEGLSLTQLSESIKKVEHSDFVALIRAQALSDETQISTISPDIGQLLIHIGKNRSGPKDKVITLKTKYSNFRIDDNMINTAIPWIDNTNDIDNQDDLSI
jgi:replicative DNA helicase